MVFKVRFGETLRLRGSPISRSPLFPSASSQGRLTSTRDGCAPRSSAASRSLFANTVLLEPLFSASRAHGIPFAFPNPPPHASLPAVRRVIYPGSFDPITNGHLDVINRAATLFDEVVVAVAYNEQKHGLFSADERIGLIREVAGTMPNVRIAQFDGLLVEFARAQEAVAVVRGLRAVSDFEFEFQMALMNRKLEPQIEAIFLMPAEKYTYLSSRIVKEIARLGGDVGAFVPVSVAQALREKFSRPNG